MQVVVDGVLTEYDMYGDGKAVLLLHGWGDTAAGLKPFAQELAKDFCVIVPNLPGFGGTQSPQGVWGLDDYVQFVGRFISKIEAGELLAVIGHSNGGAIAIRGLASGRFSAQKLVLLASAGIRSTYQGRKKALRLAAKAAKVVVAPLPAQLKLRVRKKAYGAIGSDLFVAEHLQETFKRVVTDDVQVDAAKVKTPALLIYGDLDQATPVRYGKMLDQKLQNSQLEVIAGADHFVHIDAQAEVLRRVKEFLA